MWALNEAFLGGFLHAMHIPFKGMILSACAVLFILLIYLFSNSPKEILKAALLVTLVKLFVSPHSPVTALLAVLVQGSLGFLLFTYIKSFKIGASILSLLVVSLAGVQKIIVLTLIFGNTLWDSVDKTALIVATQIGMEYLVNYSLKFSTMAISFYIGIHFIASFVTIFVVLQIPKWLKRTEHSDIINLYRLQKEEVKIEDEIKLKNNNKIKRFISSWIMLMSLALIIASFVYPGLGEDTLLNILIMLLRAVLVISIWYKFVSPMILKFINIFIKKREDFYSKRIKLVISLFPDLKKIVKFSWIASRPKKLLSRLKLFVIYTLLLVLSD